MRAKACAPRCFGKYNHKREDCKNCLYSLECKGEKMPKRVTAKMRIETLEVETKKLKKATRILGFAHLINGTLAIATFFGYQVPLLLISGTTQICIGLWFLIKKE